MLAIGRLSVAGFRHTDWVRTSFEAKPIALRMMPDYSAVPPLWRIASPTDRGTDLGLESDVPLSPVLMRHLEAWVIEWEGFHNCGHEHDDDAPPEWIARGHELLARVRSELEPFGYTVTPAFRGVRPRKAKKGKRR